MKKGFTLVELSIVLVIIGLLIGGILVAQSMIDSSKVSSFVAQIQQADAAVASFKDRFRYLPGDAPNYSSVGDGDGYIDCGSVCGATNHIGNWRGEIANFWNNIDSNTYAASGVNVSTSGSSKNVPLSKLGKSGSSIVASAKSPSYANWVADTTSPANYYAILGPSATTQIGIYYFSTTSATTAAVKPTNALALDRKIDDGVANTGHTLSGSFGDYFNPDVGALNTTAASGCSSGAAYTVATDSEQCTPIIRIGAQTGDLQ